jgi:hypothetical protein
MATNLQLVNAMGATPQYVQDAAGPTNSSLAISTGNIGIGSATPANKLVVDCGTGDGITVRNAGSIRAQAYQDGSGYGILQCCDTSAAIKVSLSANASSASYINAGNVGIGTATPDSLLDLNKSGGASGSNKVLRLRAGNNITYFGNSQVVLSWNGGTDYSHAIKSRHNSAADAGNAIDFYVWDYGTDAAGAVGTKHVMSLDGGSVGIGTPSPDPAYKLHVAGKFRVDSSPIFYATYTGIGIGVESPTSALAVDGDIATTAGHTVASDTVDTDNLLVRSGGPLNVAYTLYVPHGGGCVGIGTSSPSCVLDVAGDVEVGSSNAFYFGEPTGTVGSWRTVRSGNNLVFQRCTSTSPDVWTTKYTISG